VGLKNYIHSGQRETNSLKAALADEKKATGEKKKSQEGGEVRMGKHRTSEQ